MNPRLTRRAIMRGAAAALTIAALPAGIPVARAAMPLAFDPAAFVADLQAAGYGVVVYYDVPRGGDARAWRCGADKRHRRLRPPHSTILPMRRTRVFLSMRHLDHDPTNNEPANLAALCQRCHLLHDREEHLRRWAMTVRARRALGDLFSGPYREA